MWNLHTPTQKTELNATVFNKTIYGDIITGVVLEFEFRYLAGGISLSAPFGATVQTLWIIYCLSMFNEFSFPFTFRSLCNFPFFFPIICRKTVPFELSVQVAWTPPTFPNKINKLLSLKMGIGFANCNRKKKVENQLYFGVQVKWGEIFMSFFVTIKLRKAKVWNFK